MTRQADICKHIGLTPTPEVQAAYDAYMDAKEAERLTGAAWSAAVEQARQAMALPDRLQYAAYARCKCGAGFAYDRAGRPSAWVCSAILLGHAQWSADQHDGDMPFAYYEVKSEGQPSACGATTRPTPDAVPRA